MRRAFRVLALLACALPGMALGDDPHKSGAEEPDASFLEFLGSVDGLAEANPDYLAQGAPAHAAPAAPAAPAGTPVKTPVPPPPAHAPGSEQQ